MDQADSVQSSCGILPHGEKHQASVPFCEARDTQKLTALYLTTSFLEKQGIKNPLNDNIIQSLISKRMEFT